MDSRGHKTMQNGKVGNLIRMLRLEQNMTQKQLADKMNISDKTVSKWERGFGLPDISIIPVLSDLLGIGTQNLLVGDMTPNDFVGGNMKNTKYFVCPICHSITLCTGQAEVSCCGKKLTRAGRI
jgi:DNA-binding XRE family transcriptional regulator